MSLIEQAQAARAAAIEAAEAKAVAAADKAVTDALALVIEAVGKFGVTPTYVGRADYTGAKTKRVDRRNVMTVKKLDIFTFGWTEGLMITPAVQEQPARIDEYQIRAGDTVPDVSLYSEVGTRIGLLRTCAGCAGTAIAPLDKLYYEPHEAGYNEWLAKLGTALSRRVLCGQCIASAHWPVCPTCHRELG